MHLIKVHLTVFRALRTFKGLFYVHGIFFWSCVRDAWNQLGDMSRENAMAAYVDEMKKVAQEVEELE